MPCCACKSPLILLAVAGVAAGMVMMSAARSDDPKSEPPKPPAPPKTTPAKDAPTTDAKPAEATEKPAGAKADADVLSFKMKRIDGVEEDLSIYKGKVVMIVNTASKCGLTPQYAALEKLYESKKDKGLVILGFPANEFGSQEPGNNQEIKEFCSGDSSQYHVTFPMFEKIVVKGKGVAPLYEKLIAQPAPIGGEPKWNFTKFIVDRSGNVVARFEPRTKPDDEAVLKKIDELLDQNASAAASKP
ncbi:MAG TPA: glutathione peroxidase [Phycisphaerales bacterium]|nr:glutathione peroxidase [Phycisphaerales bacterium]